MRIGPPIKTFWGSIRKHIYIHAGTNNEKEFLKKVGEIHGCFGGWKWEEKWCDSIIILKKK